MNRLIDTLVEAVCVIVVTGIGAIVVVRIVIRIGQIVVGEEDGLLFDGAAAEIE